MRSREIKHAKHSQKKTAKGIARGQDKQGHIKMGFDCFTREKLKDFKSKRTYDWNAV